MSLIDFDTTTMGATYIVGVYYFLEQLLGQKGNVFPWTSVGWLMPTCHNVGWWKLLQIQENWFYIIYGLSQAHLRSNYHNKVQLLLWAPIS